jgi:RNA polymerase sigma factor (sigma-70 family)
MKQTKKTCCTLSNISVSDLYDPTVQNKLALLAKKGDRNAKDLLIKSMYGFVIAVAKQKAPRPDMVDDLAQEIFLTLSGRCLRAYDETKKVNFRSYAAYWIMSVVDVYLNTHLLGFPYHIPSNIGLAFRSNNKKELPIVKDLRERKVITRVSDADGNDVDIFDIVPSKDEGQENIFNEDYLDNLEKQIDVMLNEKHRDILLRYFCLGKYKDYPVNSFQGQADELGISTQRLHTILSKSYEKLKYLEK